MTKLEQVIQQVRVELGTDFVSTDVVGMDGMSIAGNSIDPQFDNAAWAQLFHGGHQYICISHPPVHPLEIPT